MLFLLRGPAKHMLGQRVSEGGKIHLISGNLRFRVPFRPYLALKNEPALSQIVLSTPPVLHETIIRWGLCDIQKNQGRGKGYQPKLKAVANTLTETLIILDITKPQLLIVLFIHWTKKKIKSCFCFLTDWKQHKAGELEMITRDLECPSQDYCIIFSFDVTVAYFGNSLVSFGQSENS